MTSTKQWLASGVAALGLLGCGGADLDTTGRQLDTVNHSAEAKAGSKAFLALGDSIAFGFNPYVPLAPPSNFVGYPEVIAAQGHSITNASCPGESSGSFLSSSAPDNGCRTFKQFFSLHADYETTQIEYAVSAVQNTAFKYITINIGANDLFLLQAACANAPNPFVCIQAGLEPTIEAYGQNLTNAFNQINGAGYNKKFVALTTYATNYNDPLAVTALTMLNNKLTSTLPPGSKVADGYGVFQTASSSSGGDACAAGLLIPKPAPEVGCDIHPSQAGRELLANTIMAAIGLDDDEDE